MIMQHMVAKGGEQMDYEQAREQIINLATQKNAMARPTPMDLGKVDQEPQGGDEQSPQTDDTWWDMDTVWEEPT